MVRMVGRTRDLQMVRIHSTKKSSLMVRVVVKTGTSQIFRSLGPLARRLLEYVVGGSRGCQADGIVESTKDLQMTRIVGTTLSSQRIRIVGRTRGSQKVIIVGEDIRLAEG